MIIDNINIENESDVEQKFIYQFLTNPFPHGLGYPESIIKTKVNIKKHYIGKGSDKKLYFPDYIVSYSSVPFLVVEAKTPDEDIKEGYREARLYATEVNASYPHQLNPIKYIICTNGSTLAYGFIDESEPRICFKCSELEPYFSSYHEINDEIGWINIQKYIYKIANELKPNGMFKVRKLLGGGNIQDEEIGLNDFASTITSSISHIINPKTLEDRELIVNEAYVTSKRRERFIDPIDKVIRASRPYSEVDTITLQDSENPKEILDKFRSYKTLENKILLLIGSVGSGKSTFIDYLQMKALPKNILDTTVWCRLNMNNAPVASSEIYTWLKENIIESCKNSLPEIDFDEIDVIKKVYGVELSAFEKGIGKLYKSDENTYNIKLAEHLESCIKNLDLETKNIIKYVATGREKLFIIVLDNCDKKNRDEQLLMFEVAQWLQNEYKCLVILPLRDETYDNNRDTPPLDTIVKEMAFRIEPPPFQSVLINRIHLALRQFSKDKSEKLQYKLSNGYKVNYPKSEQAYYLVSIVNSLFEHDKFARRLIVGLAGRNVRKALEIFLEFCNSGYISDDYIFKIRQSKGHYKLPYHLVATVLLRLNRRYYNGDESYVKNVFDTEDSDQKPNYFCRFIILQWLKKNFKAKGDARVEGYFKVSTVKDNLVNLGLEKDIIEREINYLLKEHCIVADHLKIDACNDNDMIRLAPAGFVHLELSSNVSYLAALAEDTYFNDRLVAEAIMYKIKDDLSKHLSRNTSIENATTFFNFINEQKQIFIQSEESFSNSEELIELLDFTHTSASLDNFKKNMPQDPWFEAHKRINRTDNYTGEVINVFHRSILVQLENGLRGMIEMKDLNGFDIKTIEIGYLINVMVLWIDTTQRKMGLKLIGLISELENNDYNG